MTTLSEKRINIFYCYARKDLLLLKDLQIHLKPLTRLYNLTTWSDQEIIAGEYWEQSIDAQLSTAQIILLLISPDFMASDYCYSKEMEKALSRHKEKKCSVIPILLRPISNLEVTPFSGLQMLPTNNKPIIHWKHRDDAFKDVTEGISKHVRKYQEALLALINDLDYKYPVDLVTHPSSKADPPLTDSGEDFQVQSSSSQIHLSSEIEPSSPDSGKDFQAESPSSQVHLLSETESPLFSYENELEALFLFRDSLVQWLINAIERFINHSLSTKKGIYILVFTSGFIIIFMILCILTSIFRFH